MTEALVDQVIEASDNPEGASQYLDGNSGDDADIAKSKAAPQSEKSLEDDRAKRLQAFLSRKSKSISIRKVRPEDKEDVRRIVRQLHEKTIFGHLPFSDAKFDKQAEEILKHPLHMIGLVAERVYPDGERKVVGFAWASAGTYIYSDEGVMATCHVIAVDTEVLAPVLRGRVFLMLLRALKAWATMRSAERILVNVTTSGTRGGLVSKSVIRLLQSAGAIEIGEGYAV